MDSRVPPHTPWARGGADRPRIPAVIAGFPTQVEAYDLAGLSIGLVSVRDLERHLDRERLLLDDTVQPPYWALVWSGARVLARHVADQISCSGKEVLDVGCGLGLTALAAARRGGRVTAIDRELAPIEFLLASAQANQLSIEALVGDVTTLRLDRRFDLVLAAELLYESTAFERLADAMVGAMAPRGSIWVADAQRVNSQRFYEALERRGLEIAEVCASEVREEGSLVRVRLVELRRASAVRRS